jgi:hypothetical protein
MKLILMSFLLLTTAGVWASPLHLKCTINKKLVVLDVEHLSGPGCHQDQIVTLNGQLKSRYDVEVCDGLEATGNLDVLVNQHWLTVTEFSTQRGDCYLWREIVTTTTPCRRYGHNQNCMN